MLRTLAITVTMILAYQQARATISCSSPVLNEVVNCGSYKNRTISGLHLKDKSAQGFYSETSNIRDVLFQGIDFTGSNFKGSRISDSRFVKNNFKGAVFTAVRFENVQFNEADFSEAIFVRCYFSNVSFKGSKIQRSQFVDPIFVASEL